VLLGVGGIGFFEGGGDVEFDGVVVFVAGVDFVGG
jgi:hypothetical protein